MQELDEATVCSAKVPWPWLEEGGWPSTTLHEFQIVVDSREAVLKEAGDIVVPLKKGLITSANIVAELGQLVAEGLVRCHHYRPTPVVADAGGDSCRRSVNPTGT